MLSLTSFVNWYYLSTTFNYIFIVKTGPRLSDQLVKNTRAATKRQKKLLFVRKGHSCTERFTDCWFVFLFG